MISFLRRHVAASAGTLVLGVAASMIAAGLLGWLGSDEVRRADPEIRVRAKFASGRGGPWDEKGVLLPGERGFVSIEVRNDGGSKIHDVVVYATLPENLQLVPGSTSIRTAKHPRGLTAGSDGLVRNGINIGNYYPNANAVVEAEILALHAPANARFLTVPATAVADDAAHRTDLLHITVGRSRG